MSRFATRKGNDFAYGTIAARIAADGCVRLYIGVALVLYGNCRTRIPSAVYGDAGRADDRLPRAHARHAVACRIGNTMGSVAIPPLVKALGDDRAVYGEMGLIIGVLLSSMGFDKTLAPTADQSASAVRAMYLGFIWIPVGCQLTAVVLLAWYRLEPGDLAGASAAPE